MSKTMVLKPKMSEKTYAQSQSGVYSFAVPTGANKHTVKEAVEIQFGVTVTNVRVAVVKGKNKRFVNRGGRKVSRGTRSDVKKAYITLKSGDHIPVFAALEEAAKEEPKAGKKANKEEKK